MENTSDFLDKLRIKLDVKSDYAIAMKMGMHRQHMSHYRLLKGTFDDAMSLRIADILEIDPAYVLACMHHQRAKDTEVKKTWENLARRLAAVTATIAVACFVALPSQEAKAFAEPLATSHNTEGTMYIMSNLRKAFNRCLALCFRTVQAMLKPPISRSLTACP